MVVMTSQNGEHTCDARCYNAKWFKCSCICGGKNHGVGLEQAVKASERDLSIYGDTTSEQAAGLRYELEHEKVERHQAIDKSFKEHFGKKQNNDDRSLEAWSNFILKKERSE